MKSTSDFEMKFCDEIIGLVFCFGTKKSQGCFRKRKSLIDFETIAE